MTDKPVSATPQLVRGKNFVEALRIICELVDRAEAAEAEVERLKDVIKTLRELREYDQKDLNTYRNMYSK